MFEAKDLSVRAEHTRTSSMQRVTSKYLADVTRLKSCRQGRPSADTRSNYMTIRSRKVIHNSS